MSSSEDNQSGLSEDELFREAMAGTEPLKKQDKLANQYKAESTPGVASRRAAAVGQVKHRRDGLSDESLQRVDPHAVLSYKKDGVQHGVFKKLRLGQYQLEARLDLHRMKVEEARKAVFQFVQDCQKHNIRCVLITHGKGEGREEPALLKGYVNHWLPQIDTVQAYHSAQAWHGGSGATYLLLRKSAEKRQLNLERHQSRRRN